MIKITFYPNDEARIVGEHRDANGCVVKTNMLTGHAAAWGMGTVLSVQAREGTIEAKIVTIRKAGAYTIPKLDRVNDVFGMLDYLYG